MAKHDEYHRLIHKRDKQLREHIAPIVSRGQLQIRFVWDMFNAAKFTPNTMYPKELFWYIAANKPQITNAIPDLIDDTHQQILGDIKRMVHDREVTLI
jgi:hypothetical protein